MSADVIHGDALEVMRGMADASVDLILTDPPYYRVKDEPWDKAWDTADAFLAWVDTLCVEWRRILKPNGSLYCFASPQMGHGVEGVIRKHFAVLTNIRWRKPPFSTKAEMFRKEDLRAPFPCSETIIFAEQRGSDATADDASGYSSQCEAAKRSVFGDYLRAEFARAGVTNKQVAALFPSRTGGITGCVSNWLLGFNCPTPEQYAAMREWLNAGSDEYLRQNYEELRQNYEELRRPFTASPNAPYTDVWDFATVPRYPGKHVCEKPLPLLAHIVRLSTRPNAVVFDAFCGSGSTGEAATNLGRSFIGCDLSPHWVEYARQRIEAAQSQLTLGVA